MARWRPGDSRSACTARASGSELRLLRARARPAVRGGRRLGVPGTPVAARAAAVASRAPPAPPSAVRLGGELLLLALRAASCSEVASSYFFVYLALGWAGGSSSIAIRSGPLYPTPNPSVSRSYACRSVVLVGVTPTSSCPRRSENSGTISGASEGERDRDRDPRMPRHAPRPGVPARLPGRPGREPQEAGDPEPTDPVRRGCDRIAGSSVIDATTAHEHRHRRREPERTHERDPGHVPARAARSPPCRPANTIALPEDDDRPRDRLAHLHAARPAGRGARSPGTARSRSRRPARSSWRSWDRPRGSPPRDRGARSPRWPTDSAKIAVTIGVPIATRLPNTSARITIAATLPKISLSFVSGAESVLPIDPPTATSIPAFSGGRRCRRGSPRRGAR